MLAFAAAGGAPAQFLRVGPFDFAASTYLEAVYSTNVEGEREGEATEDREDYFLHYGAELEGRGALSPRTTLTLDLAVGAEHHFVRDDLNENDLGTAAFSSQSEFRHLRLETFAEWQKEADYERSTVAFLGQSSTRRKVTTDSGYGAGVEWEADPFTVGYKFDESQTRYESEADQAGDQDETTYTLTAEMALRQNIRVMYTHERIRTEFPNQPDHTPKWLTTENIDVAWDIELWRRPKVTYSFGLEREDTESEKGSWDPRHTLSVSDTYDISRAVRFSYGANYEHEQTPEDTDIGLTYYARLTQELGATATHAIGVTREPADTFGSTQDTDSTDWNYNFTKTDLFVYGLDLTVDVTRELNEPLEGDLPDEETTIITAALAHRAALSRRLEREFGYLYSWEDSNLEDEVLEEHRVTWRYDYRF